MKDSEKLIRRWRYRLYWRGVFGPADIRELEGHLRQRIDDLKDQGIGESKAFMISKAELGNSRTLAQEYGKVNFWRITGSFLTLALVSLLSTTWLLQSYNRIELPENRSIYANNTISHNELVEFRQRPQKQLVMPDMLDRNHRFIEIWVGNRDFHGIVINNGNHDIIYIDRNNNYDLRDDGQPIEFSHADNQLVLNLNFNRPGQPPAQVILMREPDVNSPAERSQIINPDKSLTSFFTAYKKMDPAFTGAANSYYFLKRNNMQQGKTTLSGSTYTIALWDADQDGLYNSAGRDLFLIDLDGNGELSASGLHEIFYLDEIVEIDSRSYRLKDVAPDGRSLQLEKSDLPANNLFKLHMDSLRVAEEGG